MREHVDTALGLGGGDDIALVTLGAGVTLQGLLAPGGLHIPAPGPPYRIEKVELFGAKTKTVKGQVTGAMLQMGDKNWQWLDCWELGGTTPTMQYGDSGSLAISQSPQPEIFGHFVGGAPTTAGGAFSHHWVQDLSRVLSRQPQLNAMITY